MRAFAKKLLILGAALAREKAFELFDAGEFAAAKSFFVTSPLTSG
jgi:hypothetical protein